MAPKHDIESISYLSPLQHGLLFHAVSERAADPYFVQHGFVVEGMLDPDRFAAAWQQVIDRHASLRSGFAWEGVARPVQICRRKVAVPVMRLDWRDRDDRDEALRALRAADRQTGFDLLRPPLVRLTVIRVADEIWYVIISHHHLVLDGWSFAIVQREALMLYEGQGGALAAARPYRDYLAWLAGQDEATAEAFWRGALAGVDAATPLPLDGPQLVDGLPCAERVLRWSRADTEALTACARHHRVTLNTLVQGAWALLLHRHAGERDVVFGATVSGRPPDLAGSDAIVGLLINTLPVRVRVAGDERLGAWLERLQAQGADQRRFEWTPLASIQRWSDVPGGRALFDSVVVFDSYPEDLAGGSLRVRALAPVAVDGAILTHGRNNFPLSLIVEPTAELRLILAYQRRLLGEAKATSLLAQLGTLLRAMTARPDARLGELSVLDDDERRRALACDPATPVPQVCVHELVEAQAARVPDAIAVVFEETRLTYRQLDQRANQVARHLRALDVRPDDRVVVCLPRSAELIAVLLGVLKAGAAYVPVDAKAPADRLRYVIEDSGARVVVTEGLLAEVCGDDRPLGATLRPDHTAYVIYTSGSTGRPKGVAVEHRHLVNYVTGVLARLGLHDGASFALVSTLAADLGHTSLFGALASGGALHVLSEERTFDPDATADYMSRHAIDVLKIVPSHLAALLEAARPERVLPRRALVLGGEASTWALVERVEALAPGCTILNHYGPTETTVGALTWQVGRVRPPTVPIGHPLANVRAYVLDRDLQPVPVGVAGELYIGGAGVARGYHGRAALTAERFVPDPFGPAGARLYRTGDRVRRGDDGAIEFLGRTDLQIKLRGYRIELGEIEAHLREQPAVRDAVVVVRDDARGRRLVGYVIAADGAAIDSPALRAELARRLPEYMVPSALVPLASLPLTANGKIDRAALPDPEPAPAHGGFVAPRNPVETALAEIWADILGIEQIGAHDNFFTLGGDSIRTLQVIARANQRGIRLSPKHLFEHPTIAAAAQVAVVAAPPAAAPPAPPAPERDEYALSPMQEGMLFHTLLDPGSGIYLVQQHYTWTGPLDAALLIDAWRRVVDRHPILRTGFRWADLERPLQVVQREIDVTDVVEILDWRDLPAAAQEARLEATLAAELAAGFDLARAPLWRLRVVRLGDETYRIVRSFHHILTDDWCFSVLLTECLSFYAAAREGRRLELPAPRPYRDYIDWLARQDLGRAEQFWRDELRGFAAATPLGVERVAPAGGGVADVHVEVPEAMTAALLALAQQHELTLNTLVQGAWALLLGRYSGHRDVIFGVTVAGRPTDLPGVETIVGLFINSLPLRVRMPPDQRLGPWLEELFAHNYRLREHEYAPLHQIQQWSELPKGEALFRSLLVFENAPVDPTLGQQVGDVRLAFDHDRVHTNYPLTVDACPGPRLGIRLSYDRGLFEADAVAQMLAHLCHLLGEMVRKPDARLEELSAFDPRERQHLLALGAGPAAPAAGASYVEQLEAQVRRSPDAIAVSCGGRRLTYAALDHAAEQIAGALRVEGVGPDTLVAVLEARDVELVVALLGVLKAGGAYLPLDPAHPPQRLGEVLASSRAPVVLTAEAWLPALACALPEGELPRLVVRERLGRREPRRQLAGPGHLAYVIYTSGSTGVPKGAMVEHAGMLNNVAGKIPALELTSADVVGQTASQCFDISVWQMLTALLCGARVHVVPDEVVADPAGLLDEVDREGISILELVPSLLRELVAVDGAPRLASLRWMLPTGEALPPDLCRRWFERYPRVPLLNAYGPAECADDVALHALAAPPAPEVIHVPIGRPVPGLRLHVVSDDELAPIGVVGELYVGGVGVGRGYLADPARTALAFVPDRFGDTPGARLYRTGDRVRRRADGTLEFVGRRDHQVKLRGYRIELGEIEARLLQHSSVGDVVVVVREERLVAYVVAIGGPPSVEELRAHLAASLPGYMVPRTFVVLPALPRNSNGKLDRYALPAPNEPVATAAPRTPTEEILAGIWAEVLGRDRVGIDDGFFDVGGHSLLATQVVARIRRALDVELPLRSVFEHETIARLAREIDRRRARSIAGGADAEAPLVAVPRQGPLPLTLAQQRLWFLAQLEPASADYNMTAAIQIDGAVDLALLEQSFVALARRHESLRTRFEAIDGAPVQVIDPDGRPGFEPIDLSATPASERMAAVQALAAARAATPFDLARGPLVRVTAIRLADDEHALVLVLHHIIADGWSINVLVAELAELYQATRAGRAPALSPLPIQVADVAVWQERWLAGAARDTQLGYWRDRLGGAPAALDLRPDHPRPAVPSARGARHVATLDRALIDRVRALGRAEGATLFMTLLAAYDAMLFRRTGQRDLLVGTDVANRRRVETEGLIGFFVNLLVVRTDLGATPTFRELVRQVRDRTFEAYAHQDVPFDQIVDAVRPVRTPGYHPLVQTLFVLQNVPSRAIELPGLSLRPLELAHEVSRFDLGVFAEETDDGVLVVWKYRTDLFVPATIEAMANDFVEVLRAMTADPDERIAARRALRPRTLKQVTPRRLGGALVSTSALDGGPSPLVIRPAVADVDLAAWAGAERATLEAHLNRHGAILFRGFGLRTVGEFEQVARAVCGELFGEYGDLPREHAGRDVYGSTPYPPEQAILFHNESSHLPRWPLKQWFFCVQAAPEGGATPIVDGRRVHALLPEALRERLRQTGLLYVRNFTPGLDVRWQDFFQTDEPARVEARCRAGGMRCEWSAGGRLRISQRGPAIVTHPRTGEWVSFNQIQLHHPAYLEPAVREALLAMVGEDWLPRNVCYGDGTRLEADAIRALDDAYQRCAVRFAWQDGDVLFLDNMLMAHGRDRFRGPRKIVVAMGDMVGAR